MSAKKVVVTGGAGFIGSHTVDRLLQDGHQVVAIDNLACGRLDNVRQHADNARFQFIHADINDTHATESAFAGADWVFHLAALADIVPSIERPGDYHHSNVVGTFNVLEQARRHGIKRFVYAASSSCYGIPEEYPTPEESLIQPQYPYALTKYLGEEYVLNWSRYYKLPAVSLRFFNVFGPRSRTSGTYGAVFGVFLAQKLKGLPYTVVGDGKQTRDFTFVTDVADALVKAAESDLTATVLNVGTGNDQSVNTLVELLGGPKTHIPKRPGEPDRTCADNAKITQLLGWRPQISFERGVQIMLEHIDYWKNAPVWTPESIAEATQAWFQCLQ